MSPGEPTLKKIKSAALPTLDWELCIQLANHKKAVAEEMLRLVIQQLPLDLETIKEAHRKKDYPELLRYVHKMHGALCYTGLPYLKSIVVELESRLKQKTLASRELSTLLTTLEKAVQQVLSSSLPY